MTQKQKVLLAFILPAIVALLTIAVSLDKSHRQLAIERWSVEHKALVRSLASALQSQINDARALLEYTAQLEEFSSLEAVDRISPEWHGIHPALEPKKRRTLDALLNKSHAISVVFITLPNGDHYLAHPYSVQRSVTRRNMADRSYFQEARRTKQTSISDHLIGADGKPAIVVDTPLLDRHGQIYAHLGAVVLLENLSALIDPARIMPFDTGVLTDRRGNLIAHSNISLVGLEKPQIRAAHPLLKASTEAAQEVRFLRWTDSAGVEWLSFSETLETGWTLLLERRLDSVIAEHAGAVRQSTLLVGLILLMSGGLGLAMTFVVTRRWEKADMALAQAHIELESRVAERTAELAVSEARVAQSRDFYLSVLENFPALVWRSGLDAKCDYFNRTWLEFTGRSLAQEAGEGWSEGVHPDDLKRCLDTYLSNFQLRQPFAMEYRLRRHDGVYRWIVDIGRPFHDFNGEFIGYLGACFDVSERHAAAEQLQLVASVFSHAREGIIITDAATCIIDVNQAFTDITGYSRDEVIGCQPNLLKATLQDEVFFSGMWRELNAHGYWQGEIWNRKKNGELFAELLTISTIHDGAGDVINYVGIFADITQQKEHAQRLEQLAHYDPLTGLPNRTMLSDRLKMSLAQSQRNATKLAVCLLDLDGFKLVNDRLGHAAGDQLLIDFAQRIRDELRQTDTLARLGGDEFVILLNELSNYEECIEAVRRIIQCAIRPYLLDNETATISASIGITIYPDDGADPDLLLRHADQAMYIAKQSGGNRYFMFDPLKDLAARADLNALSRLQQALDAHEFELYYQPQVDMHQGLVVGAEALIRWRHPERGLVLPGDFLPLTEDTDFSITLGEWVIRQALIQSSLWHKQGLNLTVSVNIAARHLQQPDFAQRLAELLAAFPTLPGHFLELEILETAALHDTTHVASVITACRKFGVAFALDDFGTGYSSLLYLKHLPAGTLKIDQSFVRDMLQDNEDLAIVKGVIGLAQAFNRRVVAEGVESISHGEALLRAGCTLAQGYGIARPMPASELAPWIDNWQTPENWLLTSESST